MGITALCIIEILLSVIGFMINPYILLSIYGVIPTLMFCSRRLGILVSFPKIRNTEITGDVIIIILGLIFHKLTWVKFLGWLAIRVIFLLIVYYDDTHYLYIEEDI